MNTTTQRRKKSVFGIVFKVIKHNPEDGTVSVQPLAIRPLSDEEVMSFERVEGMRLQLSPSSFRRIKAMTKKQKHNKGRDELRLPGDVAVVVDVVPRGANNDPYEQNNAK